MKPDANEIVKVQTVKVRCHASAYNSNGEPTEFRSENMAPIHVFHPQQVLQDEHGYYVEFKVQSPCPEEM